MDKHVKKSLNRRLLTIYVGYLLILLIGLFSVVPTYLSAFHTGAEQSLSLMEQEQQSGVEKEWYGVAVKPAIFTSPQGVIAPQIKGNQITTMINEGFVGLTVDKQATPTEVINKLDQMYELTFWLDIVLMLCWIAIWVLIAVIINSLRRSIKQMTLLPRRNILYMRLIGSLIILAEVIDAWDYGVGNRMVSMMASNDLVGFSNSFPIEFGQLALGMLVLFSAEVFALGSELMEEQKYTI